MSERIYYTKPSITELEISYADDAVRNGWGVRCYEYIHKFERLFCEHLNVKYAIATSSCTGALHMGLAALGVGPGDEIILANTNWIATVSPIIKLGATPVFVDILPESWCLDPDQVRAAISPRTKAIVAVHIYGNLCDMDALLNLGREHGIPVIEDAAEAIGSKYHGARAGSMGLFGVFSFHGTKTVTTGEGGIFVTNNPDLYERVLTLSNHGRSRSQVRQFWPEMVGFKYKMSNVQAAIGCGQLERIEELVSRKQEIFRIYKGRLGRLGGITLNFEPEGCEIGAWMPTVVFSRELGVTREKIQSTFESANIDARVFFYPLSQLPIFESAAKFGGGNSEDIASRAINLPSYHDMTESDINRVCSVIEKLYCEAIA